MHASVLADMPGNTRRVYVTAWKKFEHWCGKTGVVCLPASETTVVNYLSYLAAETTCAPSTAQVAVAAIKLVHRRHRLGPAWSGSELIRQTQKAFATLRRTSGWSAAQASMLSVDDAEALLAAADDDGQRSSALVSMMLYTGARVGELLSATISDIGEQSGLPLLQIPGLGRTRRAIPIASGAFVRLRRYLASGQPGMPTPERPVFVTSSGKALDPKQVRRILLRCGQLAGLQPEILARLTPHSARATFAASNLAAGASLQDVQYALGHADPRTTEAYDRSGQPLEQHPALRIEGLIRSRDLS